MKEYNFEQTITEEGEWLHEPRSYSCEQGLVIQTEPQTDFWQRTHYGFSRDNGHFLYTSCNYDFSMEVHMEFEPENRYDQCGLMVRIDSNNWIKISTEYEDEEISRLGSVVTNLGYSDWATTDISSDIKSMWYRVNKRGKDFMIESSREGKEWSQMRICHLDEGFYNLKVGVYACSPEPGSFECKVKKLRLKKNECE